MADAGVGGQQAAGALGRSRGGESVQFGRVSTAYQEGLGSQMFPDNTCERERALWTSDCAQVWSASMLTLLSSCQSPFLHRNPAEASAFFFLNRSSSLRSQSTIKHMRIHVLSNNQMIGDFVFNFPFSSQLLFC